MPSCIITGWLTGICLHVPSGSRHPEAVGGQPARAGDTAAAVRRSAQDADGARRPACPGGGAAQPAAPVRAPRPASAVSSHGGEPPRCWAPPVLNLRNRAHGVQRGAGQHCSYSCRCAALLTHTNDVCSAAEHLFAVPAAQFLHHYCLNQARPARERQELARIFAPLLLRPAGCSVMAPSQVRKRHMWHNAARTVASLVEA
jgi:hypothetical protein